MALEWDDRKVLCRECKLLLLDREPMCTTPEYWHPVTRDCPFGGRYLCPGEWMEWRPKMVRRVRARGARLARKRRP